MNTIKPPALKAGDKIGIVSPARYVAPSEIEGALKWITDQGYEPVLGKHVFDRHNQFAGSDADRASDLISFINNPDITCIWATRGGYGGIRLLPFLDEIKNLEKPMWFVGYSDFTVFHSWLMKKFNMQSIHGPMLFSWDGSDVCRESFSALDKLLRGNSLEYEYPVHRLNRGNSIKGVVQGGNLSVLYSMRAGSIDLDVDQKVLFVEDLDEYLYHIDRMMQNLKNSGWFSRISGLLVGGMTEMNDNKVPYGRDAEEIIAEITSGYNIPVIFGHPAGHLKRNMPIIFGEEINIRIEGRKVIYKQ